MAARPCSDVAREAAGLVGGATGSELGPARRRELTAHAAACDACARTIARERRLQAWLAELPDAPEVPLAPPALPRLRWRRLRALRIAVGTGAAAAAAVLAAWVLLPEVPGGGSDGATLRVWRTVDAGDPIPGWDEGQLGLVAGPEAVASRRLAEGR